MQANSTRSVPRWLHVLAIATVVNTALLLILGGFVTTFRVGMADPVWPTEPWYLASNYKLDFGYLIEHVHRIIGWLLGVLGLVLTFGVWAYEPRKSLRWLGIGATVFSILAFGGFQGVLMKADRGDEGGTVYLTLGMLIASLVPLTLAGMAAWRTGEPGGRIRAIALMGMVAAMTQGLLGGVRVRYNDLAGRELSAVHGVNAQIVFGLLLAVAVLSLRPRREPAMPADVARKLRWQTLALLLFTFLQIVWGAWIRHFPDPLSNRLHLLFAFVVVGFATLAIKQALADPVARERFKLSTRVLMGLITLQVVLGVEAWLGKFLGGSLPELETITLGKAIVRTAHAHIGTWVLGLAVIFVLLSRRNQPVNVGPPDAPSVDWMDTPRFAANEVGSHS